MTVVSFLRRLSPLGAWIGPIILRLFPVILGFWNIQADRDRELEEKRQDSLERTNQAVQQLRLCSDLNFWARETSRLFRRSVEKAVSGATPESLASACSRAILQPELKGLPNCRLWAVEFPEADYRQRGKVCTGPGLQTDFKPVVQAVIPALARQHVEPHLPLHPRDEMPRLRVMFGDMVLPDLFSRDRRGQPFYTILQYSYALVTWDLIFRDGKPIGGFFLLFPVPPDPGRLALQLTFRNWSRYFRVPQLSCAFLPFPLEPGPASGPILCHPRLRQSDVMPHLQHLMRQQEIRPNDNPEVLGEVRLLTSLVGRFEALGKWWFRVCPLHPQSGRVGVLCLPQPPPGIPPRERLARTLLGLWLIAWGAVLIYRLITGEMPTPGVRLGLVMWFLALVSVPTMLSVSTSASFLSDLESNLHHQRRQEMMQVLREVEAGSSSLGERYGVLFRRLSQNRRLCEQMLEAQQGKGDPAQIMNRLWKEIEQQDIQLMAILVFGHAGFNQNVFHPNVTPDVQRAFQQFVGEFGDTTLRQADPELYEQEMAKLRASGKTRARRGQFEGLASSSFLLTQMDTSADFRMGRRHLMKYHNSMSMDGHTYFSIFFIWDQDPLYRKYLQTAIPEANRQYDWLALGAFREQGDSLETIWKPRQSEDLNLWAEQAREQVIWNRGRDRILYAYPSKRMPGYVLAATGSLKAVQDAILREEQRIGLTLLFLVLLVGLSSAGLSHWLANPILRMTEGLHQVAGGNLQIQVAENRDDEIGEAGATLDTMTGWLRERRMMSRFVAPQVLELIQSGTMDQNCSASTQEAVALVSDIRNFTTISETYPPAEVFDALNYHLQVMTRVIREQNGFIDRFIGDAIQAVFYPGAIPPAVRAVRAAAGMRRGHHLIQVHRERQKKFTYEIGIGIDYGTLVTGVLGDPNVRQEYSVLGEPMKHAAELEALSKLGTATRIIASTSVVQQSEMSELFRELDGHAGCWELMTLPEAER